MRIIAGTHRGRRILAPKDEKTTRPITDRVKQSLFDRLWSMGVLPPPGEDPEASEAEPLRVLDLFCGTGSLGLEALSRGAAGCVFVDMDRDAVGRLEKNLAELGVTNRARVVRGSALSPVWQGSIPAGSVGLICLDPPYAMFEDERGRADLSRLMTEVSAVAAEGCVLVTRTAKGVTPEPADGWLGPESHNYGSMTLHFFVRG